MEHDRGVLAHLVGVRTVRHSDRISNVEVLK